MYNKHEQHYSRCIVHFTRITIIKNSPHSTLATSVSSSHKGYFTRQQAQIPKTTGRICSSLSVFTYGRFSNTVLFTHSPSSEHLKKKHFNKCLVLVRNSAYRNAVQFRKREEEFCPTHAMSARPCEFLSLQPELFNMFTHEINGTAAACWT